MKHISNRSICRLFRFCIGMLLFCGPMHVCADDTNVNEFKLNAKVSRSAIQIADPFDLSIQLIVPAGTQVSFPATAKSLGPFEILSSDEKLDVPFIDHVNRDSDQRLWRRSMSLETLETGALEIPPVEVAVTLPDQQSQIRRTKPIKINVASVVEPSAELTQFQDIADVHDVQLPTPVSKQWFWWASSAAAIVLVLAGSAFLLTRRRTATMAAKVWALKELENASDLNQAESILRQFIEERFGFPAISLPVAQVLAELRVHGVQESLPAVKELLENSERVKFGGLDLSTTEINRLLSVAPQVVDGLDQSGGQE